VKFGHAVALKTLRDVSAEIHTTYKLFEPTTMDKTRISGSTRTTYKSGLKIKSPFHPHIPARPEDD